MGGRTTGAPIAILNSVEIYDVDSQTWTVGETKLFDESVKYLTLAAVRLFPRFYKKFMRVPHCYAASLLPRQARGTLRKVFTKPAK